jgi:hypothetical protein
MEKQVATTVAIPETEVLSSWKEIALYLGRGVRTAQRWEAELQLPVYRPWGKDHSAVVAMKSEIDLWIRSRSRAKKSKQLAAARATQVPPVHARIGTELVAHSRRLRADLARNREILKESIELLWKTVASMNGEAVPTNGALEDEDFA